MNIDASNYTTKLSSSRINISNWDGTNYYVNSKNVQLDYLNKYRKYNSFIDELLEKKYIESRDRNEESFDLHFQSDVSG